MENAASITASLQGRYASALYGLARDDGAVAAVSADLQTLEAALAASPDFAELIRDPVISRAAAARTIDAIANLLGLSRIVRNFLGVLATNHRLAILPQTLQAFAAIAAAARGEITAQVTSAHPLNEAQLAALGQRLKAREGHDVKIDTRIDPDLLGGLVVRIGSRQIDSSIRTRLTSLAQTIRG